MRRNRRKKSTIENMMYIDKESKEMVELWILRTILTLNGHREFLSVSRGFSNDDIAYFLGLDHYVDNYDEEKIKEILQMLKVRLKSLEASDDLTISQTLARNIEKVKKLVHLNDVEGDILCFALYLKYYSLMDTATRTLNELSTDRLISVLSVLLDHDTDSVKTALSPKAKLAQSGLVTIDRRGNYSFESKLDLLSNEFADRMMNFDE